MNEFKPPKDSDRMPRDAVSSAVHSRIQAIKRQIGDELLSRCAMRGTLQITFVINISVGGIGRCDQMEKKEM
jgi:hypothetical protein